ncbi:MAG: M24 family metallopeptidase [Planctomycetota bacterium]|nr:M24 family metallopeptidase [Planctomycetota bacterium]
MRLTPTILEGRLAAQRRARRVLLDASAALRPGDTERETARRLRDGMRAAGAVAFFHEPIVWFGERSTMASFRRRGDALPGGTRLGVDDSAVLDVAPVFRDGVADVSWTAGTGLEEGRQVLAELRALLPTWIGPGHTSRELCLRVAQHGAAVGWESCQQRYLMGALGHRVYRSWLPLRWSMVGLGFGSGLRLFGGAALHRLAPGKVGWPFWSDSPRADQPPGDGLWSVEPHLARGRIGMKWEELLVVEDGHARWLDPEDPFADGSTASPAHPG